MFTSSEVDRIRDDLNTKLNERRDFLKKIWGFFLGLSIFIILGFVFMFPKQFESGGTAWILPTYGGMALLTTLTGFIVSISYRSEKPFFEILYPFIYQKIEFDEGISLTYESYVKDKEFNIKGGLFTSWANVFSKRHMSGTMEENLHFDVYDTTMTTSNGKSQTVHFSGTYFVVKKASNTILQVRSNGTPKLKGVKFKRQDEFENIRVFKPIDVDLSNTDYAFTRYFERLQEDEAYKRMFLAVLHDEIHFAVSYKKHPARKLKEIDSNSLMNVYQVFKNEMDIIQQIASIETY